MYLYINGTGLKPVTRILSESGFTNITVVEHWYRVPLRKCYKRFYECNAIKINSQAGEIEMLEFGEAKVDVGTTIFNYSIAYDTKNAKPLFYETYLGSIADISQFGYTLGKVKGYGYENIGFIFDRGYFSKGNIRRMDEYGYSFVIMVKGMAKLVNRLILENKGKFEEERKYSINAR